MLLQPALLASLSRSHAWNAAPTTAGSRTMRPISTSSQYVAQCSAYCGEASKVSTIFVRLSTAVSARNESATSGGGSVPTMSMYARRSQRASSVGGEGAMPSFCHSARIIASMAAAPKTGACVTATPLEADAVGAARGEGAGVGFDAHDVTSTAAKR